MNIKRIKLLIVTIFILTSTLFAQTYDEIVKLRAQYEELKQAQNDGKLAKDGESILKSEKDIGPTRILYKPEDLEDFYRVQLSQLIKSLDELDKINKFFESTKTLSHFGYNIFTNKDTISFFDNMPLPSNYTLGSGDEVVVSLWGEVEKEESSIINRDGNIFLEDIGILSLGGIPFNEAKRKIKNSYSKTYSTLKGDKPSTFVDLTLRKLKGLNVHILGFVKSPGVYPMHPFSDPFTALFYAGGVDTTGSLRNIKVYRDGNLLETIDLYQIIHGGKFNKQIRLLDQDIIFVPPRNSKVIANGGVLSPGYFELLKSETALDLINFSGGFSAKASKSIILKRIISLDYRKNDDEAINFYSISIDSLNNFKMQNGDSLGVGFISDYFPTITINGWVKRPGKYPFINGVTLIELIELGGGINDESWLLGSEKKSINLIKYNNEGKKEIINFDYSKVLDGSQKIELNPFDEIQIAKSATNNFNNYVSISGEIKSEGIYSIYNKSINALIKDAGGFTLSAFKDGIELYRDTLRVGVNNLSMVPINGDSIHIPLRPGSVTLFGSVNNPGLVSFQKGLTINEYINLSGGYTIYANKKDVYIIYPNGIAKKKTRFSSPEVLEGSVIMVSSSQLVVQQKDYLEISQQVASIIGSLATVALIINTTKQ